MSQPGYTNPVAVGISQLTQVRAAMDDAAEIFGRKVDGRTPIVVVPSRQNRIQWGAVILGIFLIFFTRIAGAITPEVVKIPLLGPVLIFLGLISIARGIVRASYIQVPEGMVALLARGGKHVGIVSAGIHFVVPWTTVSHLVTRREVPYDAPVKEAPTRDNVRATIDTSITFMVTDPYRFVYTISPDGFDQVFQAACQDALRSMVRNVTSDQVNDLARQETAGLREELSKDIAQYGVTITKINITDARPPADFLHSQEARQLAVLQRAEQSERQALAQRQQADQEALARQQVIARVEREREQLQVQVQEAETRRRIAELEAEAELVRLTKVEEGLRSNPRAAQRELELARLEVAKALAGNSRAVLQFGTVDAMTHSLVMRDTVGGALAEPSAAEADRLQRELIMREALSDAPKAPAGPRKAPDTRKLGAPGDGSHA
ncbi:MAG TPA: SPFH domain-containing protein [Herpetosiphonaceae bacterium]|nr:SPFH domain-containing protein [Herpetosiphonaceae bacterium]